MYQFIDCFLSHIEYIVRDGTEIIKFEYEIVS